MSTVLEPAQTIQYSSLPNHDVCEETVKLDLRERPITPPITPSSAAPPTWRHRLAPSLVIAELLSGSLRAPTHCPSTRQQDFDKKESVPPILTPVKPVSNTSSPFPVHEGVAVDPPTSEEWFLNLKSNVKETVEKTEIGGFLESERGTYQHSEDNTEVQLANPNTAASNEVSAARIEANSGALVSAKDHGTAGSSSTYSISKFVLTIDIASPKIYQRDKKLFVGKMRDIQCPPHVETEWTGEIRPRLLKDLLPVLRSLPRSMASEETMIEPELCMAGYTTGKAADVQLTPTVWIRCGGKKCRKAIRKAVNDLVYLHSFSQGTVEVRIRGPRPAASSPDFTLFENPPVEERRCLVNGNMRLQLQLSVPGASACGLRLRVLNSDAYDVHDEKVLTIGGLVKVGNKIYGLTTAHGIFESSRIAKNTSSPTSQSSESAASGEDSDSESEPEEDSDTSFNTSCLDEHSPPIKRQSWEYRDLSQTAKTKFRKDTQQLQWRDVPSCGPMSYCGQGSLTGDTGDGKSALQDTDFALIDMGFSSTYQLYNEYKPEDILGLSSISIRGLKHDGDLDSGEVFLLTGQNQIIVGHLLRGSALFINKAIVFNTRKIQLDAPLPTGTSGTWVVQDNLLCGIIIAVYDDDPYAHMITADKMFQDIHDFQPSLFHSRDVVIATEDDIKAVYAKSVTSSVTSLRSVNNSDSTTESGPVCEGQPQNEDDLELLLTENQTKPPASQNIVFATSSSISYVPRQTSTTKFDTRFRKINSRRDNHKLRSILKGLLKISWLVLRKLCYAMSFPFYLIYRWSQWVHETWLYLRHVRFVRTFNYLIIALGLLLFVLSGTLMGLTTYKLIKILGKDDYLRWELPFAVSVLIFFSLLRWLWARLKALFWPRYRRVLHHEPQFPKIGRSRRKHTRLSSLDDSFFVYDPIELDSFYKSRDRRFKKTYLI